MAYVYRLLNALFGFLLKEDGDFLLLETGDKIVLAALNYTYKAKNTTV